VRIYELVHRASSSHHPVRDVRDNFLNGTLPEQVWRMTALAGMYALEFQRLSIQFDCVSHSFLCSGVNNNQFVGTIATELGQSRQMVGLCAKLRLFVLYPILDVFFVGR
jgi:hypothetical protein